MANEKLKKALQEAAMEEYLNIACESAEWEPSEEFIAQTEPVIKNDSRVRRVFRRIIPIAAVMLLLASTMILSMADVRERVINYFESNEKDHIDLQYGYNEAGDIPAGKEITDILMPDFESEGFRLYDTDRTGHSAVSVWKHDSDMIVLQQGDGLTSRSLDIERLVKSNRSVNGVSFDIYSGAGYYLILWTTEKYTFSLDCYCDIEPEKIIGLVIDASEDHSQEVAQ